MFSLHLRPFSLSSSLICFKKKVWKHLSLSFLFVIYWYIRDYKWQRLTDTLKNAKTSNLLSANEIVFMLWLLYSTAIFFKGLLFNINHFSKGLLLYMRHFFKGLSCCKDKYNNWNIKTFIRLFIVIYR